MARFPLLLHTSPQPLLRPSARTSGSGKEVSAKQPLSSTRSVVPSRGLACALRISTCLFFGEWGGWGRREEGSALVDRRWNGGRSTPTEAPTRTTNPITHHGP